MPTKRRSADNREWRRRRCRLGTSSASGAAPDAAPSSVQEPADEAVPALANPPTPGSGFRLFRTLLLIVAVFVVAVLAFNRAPWQSVSTDTPTVESTAPPQSLVRATREGVVGPGDYFRVWRHAGITNTAAEPGF